MLEDAWSGVLGEQKDIDDLNSPSRIRFAPTKHPPNSPSHDRLDHPLAHSVHTRVTDQLHLRNNRA